MVAPILQDALFAALAAIGFAAINRPPARGWIYCAIMAALGHSLRFMLMEQGLHIVSATTAASFAVGTVAVFLSPLARVPAETCFFPALLPMIPGMYAYRAFGALAMCVLGEGREQFDGFFFLFAHNAMTCFTILLGMVAGATVPVFLFKKVSFRATR